MSTWVAFLRAVNVGKRAYPMAELRACVEAAGFTEVATHIQTGNLRLSSPMRSATRLAGRLEGLFAADRGFEVPTVVMRPVELAAVVTDAEELSAAHAPRFAHYVSLLSAPPPDADAERMQDRSVPGERVVVRGRAVHLLYDVAYHEAKTSNATVERVLGPSCGLATNRNLTVLRALAQKWC